MSDLTLTHMIGFVTSTNPEAAKHFYETILGFRFLKEDPYALTFEAHGNQVRLLKAQAFTPAQGTVLGWEVEDIAAAVQSLVHKGLTFERYPFFTQDEHAICTFPGGDKVAWFKDPDGNTLSLSQHAQ